MKAYLKNFDHLVSLNILNYQKIENDTYEVKVKIAENDIVLFLKRGNVQNFYSLDGISWIALNNCDHSLPTLAIGDQLLKTHLGFIPKGQADDQEGALIAKMPGKVVKVLKNKGDKIQKGEPILIIEAMKMENEMRANASGTIDDIFVTAGQSINTGDNLATICSE